MSTDTLSDNEPLEPRLEGYTYQPLPCGCRVTGNGTMPTPLTVKQCDAHKRLSNAKTLIEFHGAAHELERVMIRNALVETEYRVSRAARLLGFKHHQSLTSLLDTRHAALRDELRMQKSKRRHSIMRPKR